MAAPAQWPRQLNQGAAMKRLIATIASAWTVTACAAAGEAPGAVAEDPRVSVEIPLEGPLRVTGADLLRVHTLLDERTEFAAADFQLREVVLVARSETATAGRAELMIMDWRSGQFDIPPAQSDEWYEVRLPAPAADIDGAWLLDLIGDLTVDTLVAVLEPRPLVGHSATSGRTVYRVVDGTPTRVITRWVHSPSHYHIYRYHHGWPYRYFWGVWNYDLVYRPHHRHYRHHRHDRGKRLSREFRKLRRVHPRVRPTRHRHWRRGDERRTFASHGADARRQQDRRGGGIRERRGSRPAATSSASSHPARVARPLPQRRDHRRRRASGGDTGSRTPAAARPSRSTPERVASPRRSARQATPAVRSSNTGRRASLPAPRQRGAYPHRRANDRPTSPAVNRSAGRTPRHALGAPSRRASTRHATPRRDSLRPPSRPPRPPAARGPHIPKPSAVTAKPPVRSAKPPARAAKPPARRQAQSNPAPRRAEAPSEGPRRMGQRPSRIAMP